MTVPGSRLAGAGVARVRQSPALLGQHQYLLGGPEPGRAGEAGLRDGDDLGGPVLERQRAQEREAQPRVHLGGVRPGEYRFRRADASATFPARSSAWITSIDTISASL